MPITTENEESKAVLERISGMCYKTESILNLCMLGFMKRKAELVEESANISKAVHEEENELIKHLTDMAAKPGMDKELIKSLMAVVSHIEMATDVLDSIIRHVKVKIVEEILFSDKGVGEVRHLFKETLTLLKTAGDAIMTRNEVLKNYIDDKFTNMSQLVETYSEEHEERLVKGLCSPKGSSLYLNIVDSQVKVVWHIKKAIDRLFGSG